MQGYEETEASQNLNLVPLLVFFARINPKTFYVFYLIHDYIWSLIFVVVGILLRIEILIPGPYYTIFGNDYGAFVYTLISFGGVFLCFLVVFSAYVNEITYNKPKKVYIIWRFIICVLHLLFCLLLLIFFAIFEDTFKSVFEEKQISSEVSDDIESYFNIGIGCSSFFVVYSFLNIFNTYTLMKACKKIQGDLINEDANLKGGWAGLPTNKIAPIN